MDHASTPAAGTANLYGVKKTLRRLYLPSHPPHAAIDQALAALARLERETLEQRQALLAPAA